jgi:hypothetical protein
VGINPAGVVEVSLGFVQEQKVAGTREDHGQRQALTLAGGQTTRHFIGERCHAEGIQ